MKIVVVDYQVGNISSIINMLKKIGAEAICSNHKDDIFAADKLILPGVGAFDYGMHNLHASGLFDVLNQAVLEQKKHILGICLGMQLLLRESEEGKLKGFGWIEGSCIRFKIALNDSPIKIPHMGWNTITLSQKHPKKNFFDPLLNTSKEELRFYFVHSYHAICDERYVLATANHGYDFPSIIGHDHILGTQFHPEKSHRFGMAFLERFLEST